MMQSLKYRKYGALASVFEEYGSQASLSFRWNSNGIKYADVLKSALSYYIHEN